MKRGRIVPWRGRSASGLSTRKPGPARRQTKLSGNLVSPVYPPVPSGQFVSSDHCSAVVDRYGSLTLPVPSNCSTLLELMLSQLLENQSAPAPFFIVIAIVSAVP